MTYRDAVLVLADRLPDDLSWAVTASANLALRGFPVEPDDVDLTTDERGAYRIADLFSEHVTRPVRRPEVAGTDRIRSHYGVLEFAETTVELMGDVEHRADGEWVSTDDVATTREFLTVEGRDVPVMPVDHELRGYRELGREERVALIEARRETGHERTRGRDGRPDHGTDSEAGQ